MNIDVERSTVTIGGRTFPACVLICPPDVSRPAESEPERSLGGQGGPGTANLGISHCVYVTCENGILVEVEQYADKDSYEIILRCPTCSPVKSDGDVIWLPETVSLVGRTLIPEPRPRAVGSWYWRNCEAEWASLLIERVSKLPFEIPEGPRVKLVPLSVVYQEAPA